MPNSTQLLLVGSIPLDTPKDVFETFGAPLGRFLSAMPDGEVGPRSHWISRIHYQVLAAHPELEVLARPRADNGIERQFPHDNSDRWQFKVRDGVERVRFGDPGWRLKPGFEAALRAEVAKIVEKIPGQDLGIQWDCAHEVQDAYGAIAQLPQAALASEASGQRGNSTVRAPDTRPEPGSSAREGAIERNVAQV